MLAPQPIDGNMHGASCRPAIASEVGSLVCMDAERSYSAGTKGKIDFDGALINTLSPHFQRLVHKHLTLQR